MKPHILLRATFKEDADDNKETAMSEHELLELGEVSEETGTFSIPNMQTDGGVIAPNLYKRPVG